MEFGDNGIEFFLDTTVIVDENKIIFDRYYKLTFSGRFLNFHSHHSLCHKRGVIYGAIDRIILLSHPKFQQKNFIEAIHIFLILFTLFFLPYKNE